MTIEVGVIDTFTQDKEAIMMRNIYSLAHDRYGTTISKGFSPTAHKVSSQSSSNFNPAEGDMNSIRNRKKAY